MTIEYHGWVALATSQENWSDGDFEEACQQVSKVIRSLCPEQGHDPSMPDCQNVPQMVYLKGIAVESKAPVIRVLEQIGAVFDRAYGEIVIFKGNGDHQYPDWSRITRYRLDSGKVNNVDSCNAL